jgi:endonuclease/exonuclease/phosphatase (EEP) superfamily protein YafD
MKISKISWGNGAVPKESPMVCGKSPRARLIIATFALATVVLSLFAGCISIPKEAYTVGGKNGVETVNRACRCDTNSLETVKTFTNDQTNELDPDGFSLLVWNVLKTSRNGWEKDFRQLSSGMDLLVLQEADRSNDMTQILENGGYHWDLAVAFKYQSDEFGVLTASRAPPNFMCMMRYPEPLISLPKTVMINQYPISGIAQTLTIVNLHLINFTANISEYRSQLQEVETFLMKHDGPLVVAGDFNSWNGGRMETVNAFAHRLALKSVIFKENNRSLYLGRNVDWVFYRGLEPIHAISSEVSTSDHNPMQVTFRVTIESADQNDEEAKDEL